jgi:FAD/FMN-containing dehydrogenase
MGGQQFATDSICIDTRRLERVISLDRERGVVEVA